MFLHASSVSLFIDDLFLLLSGVALLRDFVEH